jgi:electron transfer flavoprotein beta subunit
MGCDEAIRVWDSTCEGGDTLATSRILASAIRRLGDVDLVLLGRSAIDGDTWQTGPAVAQRLGLASLSYVIKIAELDPEGGSILVERLLDQGREIVSAGLPAVVGTTKGINEPRYTSFRGIRKASRMEYPCWSPADVGLDASETGAAGSRVRWPEIFAPPPRAGQAEILQAETHQETAQLLVSRLLADKVI